MVPASGRCFWAPFSGCADEERTATPRGSSALLVRPVKKGSIPNPKIEPPSRCATDSSLLVKGSTLSRHVARAAVGGTASCSRPVGHRCVKSRELPCASRGHALSASFAGRCARSRPPQIPSCHSHFSKYLLCRRPASPCNGGSVGRYLLDSM